MNVFTLGRTTSTNYIPSSWLASLSKMFLAFVFIAVTFLPPVFKYSAKMDLLVDDEYLATVCATPMVSASFQH
jgi:hypothetical protein